jgi:hypothetical protein
MNFQDVSESIRQRLDRNAASLSVDYGSVEARCIPAYLYRDKHTLIESLLP